MAVFVQESKRAWSKGTNAQSKISRKGSLQTVRFSKFVLLYQLAAALSELSRN